MSLLSIKFLIFLIVLLVFYSQAKDKKCQQWILILASYVYYATFGWKFLIILLVNSFFIWAFTRMAGYCDKLWTLRLGVFIEILLLAVFKYFNFFVGVFSPNSAYQVILPVGLSFYVFSAISYLADLWRKDIKDDTCLREVLLYTGFFFKIIAGPIVKAKDFFPQMNRTHIVTKEKLSWGIQKFVFGAVQKYIIADRLNLAVNSVYYAPSAYSGFSLLMISITYSMQIFFDFAGYSDMTRGLAYIFGYDLGDNFNLPYLAENLSDFWKRWHISLSSWLREYIYIPLGGNRRGKRRTYLNIFIVMIISGVWHGSTLNYLLWGVLHGLLSCIERLVEQKYVYRQSSGIRFYIKRFLCCLFNFCIVNLFWIFFRVENIKEAFVIIYRIMCWKSGITYVYSYVILFAVFMIIIEIIALIKFNGNNPIVPLDLAKFSNKVLFCMQVVSIFAFGYYGDTFFIYSSF